MGELNRYAKMSVDRIDCVNNKCNRTILEITADLNNGYCAVCDRELSHQKMEQQQRDLYMIYSKDPPKTKSDIQRILNQHETEGNWFKAMLNSLLPKLVNYSFPTKKGFDKAIQTIVDGDMVDVSGDFLYLCEPLLFKYENLYRGLKKIPRPYRELIASYQYWGVVSSDGLSSYLSTFDTKFDDEVSKGLLLLDLRLTESTLQRARECYSEAEYEFNDLNTDELESEILKDAEEYESILALHLIKTVSA